MRAGWPGIRKLNDAEPVVAARSYAQAGIPVFPLFGLVTGGDGGGEGARLNCECGEARCDRPGKHPRLAWTREATTDEERIADWWRTWPGANVGIPTGDRSGLIVIDLDVEEVTHANGMTSIVDGHAELSGWLESELGLGWSADKLESETLVARTGSGGRHIVLRDPGDVRSAGRWLPAVDLKARGGYVVAPPSRHASGASYEWLTELAPLVPDERLAAKLRLARGKRRTRDGDAPRGGGPTGNGNDNGDGDVGYDHQRAIVGGPDPGSRDEFFNRYAFELRKRGMPRGEAERELRRVWELTPGGGASSDGATPYRWETVREKLVRIWETVDVDPGGRPLEPVTDELVDWARSVERGATGGEEETGEPVDPTTSSQPPGGGGVAQVVSEPDGSREIATDLGNAARLARLLADTWRHVDGRGDFIWNGIHWRAGYVSTEHIWRVVNDIQRQADRSAGDDRDRWVAWSRATQGSGHVNAMIALATRDERIRLEADQLDANPWLLAVANGTLDLRTGELITGEVADYCTRVAGVNFEPDVECPRWRQHVELVSSYGIGKPDPELAAFIQRWAGYSLTGLVDEQKFLFGYGDGNNGKNVLIETLMRVMGTYASHGSAKLMIGSGQEHETVIADLAGPRLVFIDETPKGKINETRIKQLTGATKLRARRIARDSFEFDARFKLWIAGNNKPRVDDTSGGLWRRLDLVPFDVKIPADRRVKNYVDVLLRDEGPGILNWALEGLRAYREVGLTAPRRVASAGQAYRDEENTFEQFVSETFDVGVTERAWHPNSLIQGLHEEWCRESGIKFVPGIRQLAGDLERTGFTRDPKPRRVTVVLGDKSKTARGWIGPPLLTPAPIHLAIQEQYRVLGTWAWSPGWTYL